MRRATVADAAAIAEVHTRTWQAAYEHVFGAERLAGIDTEGRSARWELVLSAGEDVFVAEAQGRVVAFVSVGPSRGPEPVGELYAIYSLPEAWGSGAAHGLMRAAIGALRAAGFGEAVLWVLDDNPRARRFYEREGWRLDDASKEDDLLGVRVAEVRYRILL